jgi:hypothetical protein
MKLSAKVVVPFVVAGAALAGPGITSASVPTSTPPAWQSAAAQGQWNSGGYTVYNNAWNGSSGPQTTWAYSPGNWGSESTQAAGNTAVQTYPCVGKAYDDAPVSSFTSIRNTFTDTMPNDTTGLHAESADDIWLNDWNIEVMVWTDNIGQSFGGDPIIGTATIFGQTFTVYKNGSEYIFALKGAQETSGTTRILATINWLIRNGNVPASVTLTQVDYGWEVSSTGGVPADFTMQRYAITTTRR